MGLNKVSFFLLILLLNINCGKTKPKDVLSEADFEKVLVDLVTAENYVNGYIMRDTSKVLKDELYKQYQLVLNINKTNAQQFIKSYEYYFKNIERFKVRLDSLQSKLRTINLIPSQMGSPMSSPTGSPTSSPTGSPMSSPTATPKSNFKQIPVETAQ